MLRLFYQNLKVSKQLTRLKLVPSFLVSSLLAIFRFLILLSRTLPLANGDNKDALASWVLSIVGVFPPMKVRPRDLIFLSGVFRPPSTFSISLEVPSRKEYVLFVKGFIMKCFADFLLQFDWVRLGALQHDHRISNGFLF